MAGRRAVLDCPGGGDGIPTLGSAGARLATGGGALVAAAAVGVAAVVGGGEPRWPAGFVAAVGVVVLACVLPSRSGGGVTIALAVLAGACAIGFAVGGGGVDWWAPLDAALLALAAELAFDTVEPPADPSARSAVRDHAAFALAGGLLGAAVLAVGALAGTGGPVAVIAGATGAVVAIGLVTLQARR